MEVPKFEKKIGKMYAGVKLNGSKWTLLYYPVFIIRRFFFVIMIILFYSRTMQT